MEIQVSARIRKSVRVGKIEGLGPELESGVLSKREFLEERHIQILKTWTSNLIRRPSQRSEVCLPDLRRDRRVDERLRI